MAKTEYFNKSNYSPNKQINELTFLIPTKSNKWKTIIQILIISILFGSFIAILSVVNIQELDTIVSLSKNHYKNRSDREVFDYLDIKPYFCGLIANPSFNFISHPFALILILIYMFLFNRKSYCVNCCLGRPALPMIIHPYKKFNRLNSALVYGLIASSIIDMFLKIVLQDTSTDLIQIDTSGLFDTTVLVPNSSEYYVIKTLEAGISGLATLLVQVGKVILASLKYYPLLIAFYSDSFIIYITSIVFVIVDLSTEVYKTARCEDFRDIKEFLEKKNPQIERIISNMNGTISFGIMINLPTIYLLSHLLISLCSKTISNGIKKSKKFFVNEEVIFYSKTDINYCVNLINKKETVSTHSNVIKRLYNKYIYEWDDNFRFSSRIVNAHIVAFFTLYYFLVFWVYVGIVLLNILKRLTSNLDAVLEFFEQFGIIIPLKMFVINEDHTIIFLFSAVASSLVCIVQSLFGLRGIKKSLLLGYKGAKEYKTIKASNVSIATGSSHFSGYLVAFLLNGFLFIFIFFFLVSFTIYLICTYFSEQIFNLFLLILPVLLIFTFKTSFDFVCAKFIFLQEKGKYLALNNYRVYSIFVYMTFFLDIFVGYIIALLRIAIGLLGFIIFMPRIGYSFLGSQIEQFDKGFNVFDGYTKMEIAHSHPVLVSFCALLCSKRLNSISSNVNKVDIESTSPQDFKMQEFELATIVNKKQRIKNKWFLIFMLINNNSLIKYRKKEYSFNRVKRVY